MKKIIALVVFVCALLAGPRMVSASDLTLPIGSEDAVYRYLVEETDEIWVNVKVQTDPVSDTWTILDGDWIRVDEIEGTVLRQKAEELVKILLDRSVKPSKADEQKKFLVGVAFMKDGLWKTFFHVHKFFLESNSRGIYIPSSVYEVPLTPSLWVPVYVQALETAVLNYSDGEKEVKLVVQFDGNGSPFTYHGLKEILFIPHSLATGKYRGALTLTFKHDIEQVFDLQPYGAKGESNEISVGISKSSEGILLTMEGSPGQEVEIQCSSDLKHWKALKLMPLDTSGAGIFIDTRKEGMCFYRVIEKN